MVMTDPEIKALRQRLELSQTAFAARLNALVPGLHTTQQRVNLWEHGKHAPREMAVLALATLERASQDQR